MSLQDGAHQLGIELSAAQVAAFETYQAELLAWNARFNLTAITEPAEIETKHFLDSLSCLLALPELDGQTLPAWLASSPAAVDVGAGAGFPGLPLKIVWPGLRLTLLESTGKKCRFLEHVVAALGLQGVSVVQSRAEDYGRGPGRDRFDLALVRAVARLPVVLEYGLPLLRTGGWLLVQKGREPEAELAQARRALRILGGRLARVQPVAVPGLDAQRTLVLVTKVKETPRAFPRQAGTPQRQPLE